MPFVETNVCMFVVGIIILIDALRMVPASMMFLIEIESSDLRLDLFCFHIIHYLIIIKYILYV